MYFLFVHSVTDIFLVRGLGIKEQLAGRCEGLNLLRVSFCRGGPKRRSTDQNQEHFINWNNKFETLLLLFSKPM
jgi:hypothetical protein